MYIFKSFILICILSLSIFSGSFALGQQENGEYVDAQEKINAYTINLYIQKDASLKVIEQIDYDFGVTQRHGIYRYIPFRYNSDFGDYHLEVSNIHVTNERGHSYRKEIKRDGSEIAIRIGDPDKTISGKHTYFISYDIIGGIRYFDDHDQLYWNAIGTGWNIPIQSNSVTVHLPETVEAHQIQLTCFYGNANSTNPCPNQIVHASSQKLTFQTGTLSQNQGMTIVVGFPKGIVLEPTALQKAIKIFFDNGMLLVPIFVIFILFYLWYTRGRDPKGRQTIIAQYDIPNDMTPSEVGTMIDENMGGAELVADIIYLATKGYIKIRREEIKKFLGKEVKYYLIKIKDGDDISSSNLKKLYTDLFSFAETMHIDGKEVIAVSMEDLKDQFVKEQKEYKASVYTALVDKKLFVQHPEKVRNRYTIAGIIGLLFFMYAGFLLGEQYYFAGVISSALVISFGFFMPKKTKEGVLIKEHILGLKKYLTVAEKDRLKFHHAPEKNPQEFDRLLPYAIALGVEKSWATQFKDMTEKPSWYDDTSMTHFSMMGFINDIQYFNATASVSSSSSSGFSGGSVGGGFGGGGGGSW